MIGKRVRVHVSKSVTDAVEWFQDEIATVVRLNMVLGNGTKNYQVLFDNGRLTSFHESWLTVVNKRCPMESGK